MLLALNDAMVTFSKYSAVFAVNLAAALRNGFTITLVIDRGASRRCFVSNFHTRSNQNHHVFGLSFSVPISELQSILHKDFSRGRNVIHPYIVESHVHPKHGPTIHDTDCSDSTR